MASFLLLAVFIMRLIKWPVSVGKTTGFHPVFSVSHSAATAQLLSSPTGEEARKDLFLPDLFLTVNKCLFNVASNLKIRRKHVESDVGDPSRRIRGICTEISNIVQGGLKNKAKPHFLDNPEGIILCVLL